MGAGEGVGLLWFFWFVAKRKPEIHGLGSCHRLRQTHLFELGLSSFLSNGFNVMGQPEGYQI